MNKKAPECFDQIYSDKSDSWSFAILIVEIITRQIPYPEMNALQVAKYIGEQRKAPLDLSVVEKEYAEFMEVITACLQYEPQARPKFSEIIKMLGQE